PATHATKMRFSLKIFKRKTLAELILKSRQARIGRPPKKLQKKPSEHATPQPKFTTEPEPVPNKQNTDAESVSVRTEPFHTLSIIEEEHEPSSQSQTSREAHFGGNIGKPSHTQHSDDDSISNASDISDVSKQGLTAYIRQHHKRLSGSMKGLFDAPDQASAQVNAPENTKLNGIKPGSNTPEENMSEFSDNASSIYSDNEDMAFSGVDMNAILDYTAADNQLSASQVVDIHGDIALLRAKLYLEDEQPETSSHQSKSEDNNSPLDQTRRYPTPETDDSNNERLSAVALSISIGSSKSVNNQAECDNIHFFQSLTPSTKSTEASSTKTQSISSYFTARTSAFAPFLEANSGHSSNRSSTASSDASSTSNFVESSSTEALPSPASLPTGQTTPFPDTPTKVNGKQSFTIGHMIEIDEYCKKRDQALQMGAGWLPLLWGFEGLQRQFKRNYGWEPDLERFEDFEERRKLKEDFWIMWDFPTSLI
ncbi:hypothetical protein N431DRAFT_332875, partial [Stipitochalara longipes BDJ]